LINGLKSKPSKRDRIHPTQKSDEMLPTLSNFSKGKEIQSGIKEVTNRKNSSCKVL
jgi:ribosomal protein L7Ae-like RNA K-turn-binding protein